MPFELKVIGILPTPPFHRQRIQVENLGAKEKKEVRVARI
jgi:hypothetical protein